MKKRSLLLAIIGLVVVGAVGFLVWAVQAMQPSMVSNAVSPNGQYDAYVLDYFSVDGPNQSLFVGNTKDNTFMMVDNLAEDVDAIRSITWSEDSKWVCFLTKDYIITVDTERYDVHKTRTAKPWQWKNDKAGAYSSAVGNKKVSQLRFAGAAIEYAFEGEVTSHRIALR